MCVGKRDDFFAWLHNTLLQSSSKREVGVHRGAVLCNPRRPGFFSRVRYCCSGGTGRANYGNCNGIRCEIGFCCGTVLCEIKRPSFTTRLCDCCAGGVGRANGSGLGGPSFTFTSVICEFGFCCVTVLRGCAGIVVVSGPRRPSFKKAPRDPSRAAFLRTREGPEFSPL